MELEDYSMFGSTTMIRATSIESLTNFQKNAKAFAGKLEASKEPLVLTVNGKAKLVIQDAEAYQAMLDELERTRFVEAVRQGLKEVEEGQGIPAEEALSKMKAKYGL